MKNRLGIVRDPKALQIKERELTANRLETAPEINGSFDEKHLREIHKHIFQDVYEWAGTLRSDTIQIEGSTVHVPDYAAILSKGGSTFLPAQFIQSGLSQVERLANTSDARSTDPDAFAAAATEVLSDLNHVHPFREGNGRTQRAFMQCLATRAGHTLSFRGVTEQRNIEASIHADRGTPEELHRIIRESLDTDRVNLRVSAVIALNNAGIEVNKAWVETPETGDRINGTITTRTDDHVSVLDGDNRYIALPAAALSPTLASGDVVDFRYQGPTISGQDRAIQQQQLQIVTQLKETLEISGRPLDHEMRKDIARAVKEALPPSGLLIVEKGDVGPLATLTDDPMMQKALAFEYLWSEVAEGRTELADVMRSMNRQTQSELPQQEGVQMFDKQGM